MLFLGSKKRVGGTGQNGGTESEIYVTLYESLGVTYFEPSLLLLFAAAVAAVAAAAAAVGSNEEEEEEEEEGRSKKESEER
uniref:Uncharacterized protein n=1 Tax=Vespula pensylvanica TaxID=30213 RepID=A0A834P2B7_VESPE|nr:hypothetical protein H0235_007973 [Vespula pensylvanica]